MTTPSIPQLPRQDNAAQQARVHALLPFPLSYVNSCYVKDQKNTNRRISFSLSFFIPPANLRRKNPLQRQKTLSLKDFKLQFICLSFFFFNSFPLFSCIFKCVFIQFSRSRLKIECAATFQKKKELLWDSMGIRKN